MLVFGRIIRDPSNNWPKAIKGCEEWSITTVSVLILTDAMSH